MTASLDNVIPSWADVEPLAQSVLASPLMNDALAELTPIEGVLDFSIALEGRLNALGADTSRPSTGFGQPAAPLPAELGQRVYGAFLRETDPEMRAFALQLVDPEIMGTYAERWERECLRHTPSLAGRTGVAAAPDPVGREKDDLAELHAAADLHEWELRVAVAEAATGSVRHRMRETRDEVLALVENRGDLADATRVQRLADAVGALSAHVDETVGAVRRLQHWWESDPAYSWRPEITSADEALRQASEALGRLDRPFPLTIESVARGARTAQQLMQEGGVYGVPGRSRSNVPPYRQWHSPSAARDAGTLLDRVDALRDKELRGALLGLVDPERDLPPEVAPRWGVLRSLARQPLPHSPEWTATEKAEHPEGTGARPATDREGGVCDTAADVPAASVRADVIELVRARLQSEMHWIVIGSARESAEGFADAVASLSEQAVAARGGVDRATSALHPASAHRIASAAIGSGEPTRRSAGARAEGRPVTHTRSRIVDPQPPNRS